ncbi:helix-turn-helix domain-containing protein [Deinococcus radiomollis]|uniref:winged helix-turn-helix domain-containing protein n=1 Tax=Deinococcus radiomollis TaxID=468916 RepID=UPI0038912C0B
MPGVPHRTASAEQARLLLDVELRPLLALLMNTPSTASEVAARLGLDIGRAHYRLTRLVRAGVAEVMIAAETTAEAGQAARAGRALKHYRVAGRWFIPYEVTGADTLEAFMGSQIMPRVEGFVRLSVEQIGPAFGQWGYWHEQDGTSSTLRLGDPDGFSRELFEGDEPFLFNIGALNLRREHASELKRRLLALVEEFAEHHDTQEPAYTLGLLLARGDVG